MSLNRNFCSQNELKEAHCFSKQPLGPSNNLERDLEYYKSKVVRLYEEKSGIEQELQQTAMLAKEQENKNKGRIRKLEEKLGKFKAKVKESNQVLDELKDTKNALAYAAIDNAKLREELEKANSVIQELRSGKDFLAFVQCQACLLEDIIIDQ